MSISPLTINPSNQSRSDSKAGYIDPLPPRNNLVILTGYQVTQITFNGTTDANGNVIASGITFQAAAGQQSYTAKANKEVILRSVPVSRRSRLFRILTMAVAVLLARHRSCSCPVSAPRTSSTRLASRPRSTFRSDTISKITFPTPCTSTLSKPVSIDTADPSSNLLTWNKLAQDTTLQAEQLAIYEANRTGMWTYVNAALGCK